MVSIRAVPESESASPTDPESESASPRTLSPDIGEFAGRTFDYHAAHPELARLLQWEGLAGGPAADEINRTAHYQRKVQAFAAAQRDGLLDDDLDPAHPVFLIIALAAWWQAVPQLARMLTGADGADPADSANSDEAAGRTRRSFTRVPLSVVVVQPYRFGWAGELNGRRPVSFPARRDLYW
jgi:hypothetical protein